MVFFSLKCVPISRFYCNGKFIHRLRINALHLLNVTTCTLLNLQNDLKIWEKHLKTFWF